MSALDPGSFVTITQAGGIQSRGFVAGPADAKFAVYFGVSDATKESVNRLGALGYRALAVDIYGGKSATGNEEAVKLMQSMDSNARNRVLQA